MKTSFIKLLIAVFLLSVLFSCNSSQKKTDEKQQYQDTEQSTTEPKQEQPLPATEQSGQKQIVKFSTESVQIASEYMNNAITSSFPSAQAQTVSDITEQQLLSDTANKMLNAYVEKKSQNCFNSKMPIPNSIQIRILETDELNSFSAGNQVIFITRKLLKTAGNERMQAALIAHEIAHISLNHNLELFDENNIYQSCENCLYRMIGNGYGFDKEFKADNEAVSILENIGYSRNDLIDALLATSKYIDPDKPDIAMTHPSINERISKLK